MHRALALTGLTALALTGTGIAVARAADTGTAAAPARTTAAKAHHRAPLHAEAVRRGGGGFVTVGEQRGTITAVTPTSVTARSVDGFTRTYALTPTTKVRLDKAAAAAGALKVGERVRITAVEAGTTWNARRAVAHS